SVNGTPAVGDWEGLVLFPKATQVQIDGCIIEYAGRTGGWATAAITFSSETKPTPNIKIANTTFRHNKEAAIDGFQNDCGEAGKPDSGNKSDGVPLCKKK
ncbi:MAG: hypothetical protein WCI05_05480, partial [Myxococcales bacterium]